MHIENKIERLRYVFPKTTNFRETRPTLCWEHMYGWMEGYGMLFDPAVFSLTGVVPEWENGWNGEHASGDFIVAPCVQASELFADLDIPGIYVRSPLIPGLISRSLKSEKEKLTTPAGEMFYPFNLPYDAYEGEDSEWKLGEKLAVKTCGKASAVAFEMFAMVNNYRNEIREKIFVSVADMLAALIEKCGVAPSSDAPRVLSSDIRMDCQAYGLNRLLMQWFLETMGRNRDAVKIADASFVKVMVAIEAGEQEDAQRHLRQAFKDLAEVRQALSAMDVYFLEYPHLGILFEDKGFFELEWPHYSRETMLSYVDRIEGKGYKVSLEAGAACWKNLAVRYPLLGETLAELWKRGDIELTNGTLSLPYALMSSLALQYWQFKKGNATFEEVFGKTPSVYQCQENSLTPQMPELLRHFGYQRALHITQNHGEAPAENTDFIEWASPAGHAIHAMTARHPALSRKGGNYFLDLPLVHAKYGVREKTLNYVNFQDIGYVPFKLHMIQAHHYAPVWGRFGLDKERFEAASKPAPIRSYSADAYKFSEKYFYPDETNANPFSHYESITALSARLRQLRIAGCSSGQRAEGYRMLDECFVSLCLLEAHDCSYVQGQRRGEFAARNTSEVPPYSRETLTEKLVEIVAETVVKLDQAENVLLSGQPSSKLFNAAEVPLAFGRLRSPESYTGEHAVRYGSDLYAAGPFASFSSSEPAVTGPLISRAGLPFNSGLWEIETDEQGKLVMAFNGQKITCIPVDKQQGAFTLLSSAMKRAGGLNFLRLHYQHEAKEIQSVILEVVFAEQSDYAEINLKYSARSDFDVTPKWDDYLALNVQTESALENVWRFNPNVCALTDEDRTVSPYYISAACSDGSCLSLMNEGASLYELDRKNGTIGWLFHVSGETVFNRRMGIVFASSDAFQLSRAWSQGLLSGDPDIVPLLKEVDWQGVSVEDFVTSDTLLVSNLSDADKALTIPRALFSSATNMIGENIVDQSHLRLKCMELAVICVQQACV